MRRRIHASVLAALLLSLAAAAHAQPGSTDTPVPPPARGTPAAPATATAPEASVDDEARLSPADWIEAIKARGAEMPANRRAKIDSRLRKLGIAVDREAEAAGTALIATRLAAEFNTTAEALIREEARHACGWGNLTVARVLLANSNVDASVDLIYRMRQERVGWAQIAAGMGFHLDDVVRAVKAESGVARGREQADGKVSIVRGEGSIHGVPGVASGRAGKTRAGEGDGIQTSFPPVKTRDR